MPPPIDDAIRAAILEDIRAGQLGNRAIAKKHGVSPGTVTNIKNSAGEHDAFERSQTKKATHARQADAAAIIAEQRLGLAEDIAKLRKRAWEPYQVVVGSPAGPEIVTLDQPPLGEVRSAYTSIGIIIDKHMALDRHSSGDGLDEAVSMLGALAEGIRRFDAGEGGDDSGEG